MVTSLFARKVVDEEGGSDGLVDLGSLVHHALAAGANGSRLKPQDTKATLLVQCSTCRVQVLLPAQRKYNNGTESLSVTFKADLHTRTCEKRKTFQAVLQLHLVPADGGWKPACKGSLLIAASSPTPQKKRLLTSMLVG